MRVYGGHGQDFAGDDVEARTCLGGVGRDCQGEHGRVDAEFGGQLRAECARRRMRGRAGVAAALAPREADEVARCPLARHGEVVEGIKRVVVEVFEPLEQGEQDIAGELGIGEGTVEGGAADAQCRADRAEGVAGEAG